MTTAEQTAEIEVMQKLAKGLLITLVGFATLFVVSGVLFTMIMH